jgi:hypothetical protein
MMSATLHTPAPAGPESRPRADREPNAGGLLARVGGEVELRAAVLALLLPRGSQRAARAWRMEVKGLSIAPALRDEVLALPAAARLLWFEALVSRMGTQSLKARQRLLEATRRVMGARGNVRPIDRLHWLAMRQRLGGGSPASMQTAAAADVSRLPQSGVFAIAVYTAYLSRIVPGDADPARDLGPESAAMAEADMIDGAGEAAAVEAPGDDPRDDATVAADTDTDEPALAGPTPGEAWYETVMERWRAHAEVGPCSLPDSNALVHALHELQAMPWMQRPVLVRHWLIAAQAHSPNGWLDDQAADALRLSSTLLDSPLPPELARHYAAVESEIAR